MPVLRALAMALVIILSKQEGPAPEGQKPREQKAPQFHAGLPAATEAAEADGALVLIVFEAKWCGACQALREKTLGAQDFRKSGGPLHVVEIDVDADARTAQAYQVGAIPDLVLLTADGKIVARRQGFAAEPDLLIWLADARRRAEQGLWEGTAPRDEADQLQRRARLGQLTDDDLKQLVQLLGGSDPASRSRATRIVLDQRDRAVPFLIEGVADAYLGARIGASEVLAKLAPDAPGADPWQSPADCQRRAAALKAWWAKAGALPAPEEPKALDPVVERSVEAAIKAVVSTDPVGRTEGMGALVRVGQGALPRVVEAIRRAERMGNQKALWALEDVRWAILIPDGVEALAKGVRRDLARGASQERQAAAARLAGAGRDALPALKTLIDDNDPLVKEAAVQALSAVGGDDALLAMSVLLKAADSNLRMTAAQSLGHTKDKKAAKYLVTVLGDPDEVVACAAIAALEEVGAADVRAPLVRCLADPRWRIRAAAAEVIGKLKVPGTEAELTALLKDTDPFVVKSALDALRATKAMPNAADLEALAQRAPALLGVVVEFLVSEESPNTLRVITRLYDGADGPARAVVLGALTRDSNYEDSPDDYWQPLLAKAIASPDGQLRRLAAVVLANRSHSLAADLVTPLLDDQAEDVRLAAAEVVLKVAAFRWGVSSRDEGRDYGVLRDAAAAPPAEPEAAPAPSRAPNLLRAAGQILGRIAEGAASGERAESPAQRHARAQACLKQHAEWHALLLKHAGPKPSPSVTLAIYATGDARADLPLAARFVEGGDIEDAVRRSSAGLPMGILLRRLPWPEGKPVLEKLCAKPFLHAMALSSLRYASAEARGLLAAPDRILASLAKEDMDALESLAPLLLARRSDADLSLSDGSERSSAILKALIGSDKPALRAMALYVVGRRGEGQTLPAIVAALKDGDPWIRRAAVQGIAAYFTARSELEGPLGPLLADPDGNVVEIAAIALLLPEVRQAAGLDYVLQRFEYGEVSVYGDSSYSQSERPLEPLPNKPAFLAQARKALAAAREAAAGDEGGPVIPLALLLAQYGDFSGLDPMVRLLGAGEGIPDAVVTGIALSKDPAYIPMLRKAVAKTTSSYRLREMLKAIRSMDGQEARDFRRDINSRIRELDSN